MMDEVVRRLFWRFITLFSAFVILFIGVHHMVMQPYYYRIKKDTLNTAYRKLMARDDLTSFDENEPLSEFAVEDYYSEGVRYIIMDGNFDLISMNEPTEVYTRRKEWFILVGERFTGDAVAVYEEEPFGRQMALYGRIGSGDREYLVFLFVRLSALSGQIKFAQRISILYVIVTILLAAVIMYFVIIKGLKPFGEFPEVVDRVMEGDYGARILGKMPDEASRSMSKKFNMLLDSYSWDINVIENLRYVVKKSSRSGVNQAAAGREMSAQMTHQLKTPLAIISSQVELNKDETDPKKREFYYNSIMEEIDKLSNQISGILRAVRKTDMEPGFVMSRMSLSKLISELCPKYESWLASKSITFESSMEGEIYTVCDGIQIEQAVNNYMMNASKHTKPGKTIRLTLRTENGSAYIGVHNEGKAISIIEIDQIWKRYFQASSERGDTETGLGLYIVEDIVKKHGGKCGAFNDSTGVEFYIILPIVNGDAAEELHSK
ncbi:MAG: HAMP domain-containing sensor histidine kinase [Lachnospiraceae bacterium]|nr:HAMP domain-containing sensor histidine kinase [Lachnospiraceae bacterium]